MEMVELTMMIVMTERVVKMMKTVVKGTKKTVIYPEKKLQRT